MRHDIITRWLQDERVVEDYEIAPGYILAVRREGNMLGVYALSKSQIRLITSCFTLEEAREAITEQREWFLDWLEKRRKKEPTPAQLAMLFQWKIPILPDLTFGQVWDIIDNKIQSDKAARAAARQAKLHLVPLARDTTNQARSLTPNE